MVNIELNYKVNESTYEVLYPNSESDFIYSSQALISLLSLSSSDTLDEAFAKVRSLISSAQSRADSALSTANGAYNLASNLKIELVSYDGTGTYGETGPNSLSFSFSPDVVFYLCKKNKNNGRCEVDGVGYNYSTLNSNTTMITETLTTEWAPRLGFFYDNSNRDDRYGKTNSTKKTFYWYATSGPSQLNDIDYTYYFLALKG